MIACGVRRWMSVMKATMNKGSEMPKTLAAQADHHDAVGGRHHQDADSDQREAESTRPPRRSA